MENFQIRTEDGQLRPNQPAKDDPNESILDIGDEIDLSETEKDTGDIEIPDTQPARENPAPQPTWEYPAPQPTRERVMGNLRGQTTSANSTNTGLVS